MTRQEKTGLAAGDAEALQSDVIDYFMNRDSEVATVSEPNRNFAVPGGITPSLQHRQSLPTVWTTDISDRLSQGRGYNDNSVIPAPTQVEITNSGNNNARHNIQKTINKVIAAQENNSMPAKKQNKHRVHFSQDTPVNDGRVSSVSRSLSRLRDSFRVETPTPLASPNLSFQNSNLTSNNSGSKAILPASKSVTYRKAKLFCLFWSGIALACTGFEIGFLFACLYLKRECGDIASFIVRLAFISVCIIVLEWLRSCFWREKPYEKDIQSLVAEQDEVARLASMNPATQNRDESQLGISNPSGGDITLGAPDLRIDEVMDTPIPRARRQVLDGKMFAVSCILILFYVIFVGLMIGGAVWIPNDYVNRTSIYEEELNEENVLITTLTSTTTKTTTLELIVPKSKKNNLPKAGCPLSGIYTGLVYLVIHAIFLVIRICFFVLTSGANCLRFIVERFRIRSRSHSANQSYTVSHQLPGLNPPTMDFHEVEVPKRCRPRN